MDRAGQGKTNVDTLQVLLQAVEDANEAFVVIDADSRVVFFNRAAERLFGRDRRAVLGRDLGEIIGGEMGRRHRRALEAYLASGQGRFIGHRNLVAIHRPNGETVAASLSISETRVEDRRYFTGILYDLTEQLRLEERAAGAERFAQLGRMLAEISHEIKNPLVTIGGFARQVERKLGDPRLRAKLTLIADEAARLEGLLAELRDVYAPSRLELADVDLETLASEVCHQMAEAARERSVVLRWQMEAAPLRARVDRRRLKQVLLNLVKNALEAMDQGGEIVIGGRRAGGGRVQLEVRDTGPGINPQVMARIFDPFYTTKPQGSGLGLCISKRIVEEHDGGALLLESEEGHGTVVRVFLPAAPQEG